MRSWIIGAAVMIVAAFSASPVLACGPQVRVQFVEATPDRFHIKFENGPKMRLVALRITLNGSAAGAFFDDYDGLYMQGPQPNPAGVAIRSVTYRDDRAESVLVTFDGFFNNRSTVFYSDLDDHGKASDPDQNHIAEGELEGATAHAVIATESGRRIEIDGRFDKKNNAYLGDQACV